MYERYIIWLPLTRPQQGTWPTTQACALTGNRTSSLSDHRPALSPLSHTSQGHLLIFLFTNTYLFTYLFTSVFIYSFIHPLECLAPRGGLAACTPWCVFLSEAAAAAGGGAGGPEDLRAGPGEGV